MTIALRSNRARGVTSHIAVRALFKSVLITMLAPALLYKLAAPHFAPFSLMPLAISGIPPILWLAYGLAKLRAIDVLGFFAAENVVVSMAALVLSHTERDALLGRSMQNVLLAAVFLASLAFARPLMFYMSRQLSSGNDPKTRRSFERAASQPNALAVYRALTWGWILALLIKAAGGYYLAAHFSTRDFLVYSPLWDLVSDSLLVTCTVLYGRARLGPPAGGPHLPAHAVIAS
jgi:hypothetical protein